MAPEDKIVFSGKPNKFGIKVFALCDANNGYIYNFEYYERQKSKPAGSI